MIRFLPIMIAAASLAVATAASAGERTTFTLDGQTYTYTSTTSQDGTVVLTGKGESGKSFRFVKHGERVTGDVNNVPVSFTVSESRGAARGAILQQANSSGSVAN